MTMKIDSIHEEEALGAVMQVCDEAMAEWLADCAAFHWMDKTPESGYRAGWEDALDFIGEAIKEKVKLEILSSYTGPAQ